jgi:hypothetical protein
MGKGNRLGERAMSRFDVLHMIKRRAEPAGSLTGPQDKRRSERRY